MPRLMSLDKNAPVTLTLSRRFGAVEEFTLFEDKVRVETKRRFSNAIVEIPLRFLDSTWAIQKGGRMGHLVLSVVFLLTAVGLLFTPFWEDLFSGRSLMKYTSLQEMIAAGLPGMFLFGAVMSILSWHRSRFDVIAFTTLHPNYGNLVIARDAARELEIMQFADAVSERIKLLQLTKPDG